jgi:predicted N-acyltransferase
MQKNTWMSWKVLQNTENNASIKVRLIDSIGELAAPQWNALSADNYPFLRHEFLAALEDTGCASEYTGWKPHHLICEDSSGNLLGGMPLYLKNNSYGEFVFDFSWANAYHQAGLDYYPKLVAAIPFTPATGPRILARGDNRNAIQRKLLDAAVDIAKANDYSSMHVLMPGKDDVELLKNSGMLIRKDCQFHWHNQNYASFDDFLGTFTASKRKKVRRERRRIAENHIHFKTRLGAELTDSDWARIMPLYRHTFIRRGREPYLGQDFFVEIAKRMPESLVVFMGELEGELVSVAICFRSDTALYGRYWGSTDFIDSLHFETCYYQGIDYCIEHGLQLYEPGTQGEHKISRGFSPTETWSAHWLLHQRFASAINDFLDRERDYIDEYIVAAENHVPYRKYED